MRKRQNGFTKFMRKLEGETNNDNFSETEGLGSELYQRYEWLFKLLRSEHCWGTYFQGMRKFSFAQRNDWAVLRDRIGLDVPSRSMGVYVTDRSFYRKAIEYLREYQDREQQERVSPTVHGPVSLSDTDNVYLSPDIVADIFNTYGPSAQSSRSR